MALTGFGRKHTVTILASEVGGSGSHTNFPALVTLNHLDTEVVDAGSNSALNGGGDIRFSTDSAGTTQLACEVKEFITNATPGNRRCVIWVKIPSLSTSVDTVITIWYKKPGETQPAVTDTYGRNNVWPSPYIISSHDGGETDSTGNNSMTELGSPSDITGPFGNSGGAKDMGGVSDFYGYFTTISDAQDFTLKALIRPSSASPGDYRNFLALSFDGSSPDFVVLFQNDDTDYGAFTDEGNEFIGGGPSTSDWQWVTLTVEEGVGAKLYIDGVQDDSSASFNDTPSNKGLFAVGLDVNSNHWSGDIAETSYISSVQSAGWLTTEYNNQSDPVNFATAGTPEAVGGDIDLVIADGTSAHAADGLALVENITLTVVDTAHAHASDGLALSQSHALVLSDVDHNQSADVLELTQEHSLEVSSPEHGHAVDGLTLIQEHIIQTEDGLHNHASDNLALTGAAELSIHSASQAHSADGIALTQDHILIVVDTVHGQIAANIGIGQVHNIAVSSSSHTHAVDSLTLATAGTLLVQDGSHAHNADLIVLTQSHTLSVNGSTHALLSNVLSLITASEIIIQRADHTLSSSSLQLAQQHTITPDDAAHALVSDLVIFGYAAPSSRTHVVSARDGPYKVDNNRTMTVSQLNRTRII